MSVGQKGSVYVASATYVPGRQSLRVKQLGRPQGRSTNVNIPLFKPFVPPEVDVPLLTTLHSGYITQGSKVEEFERLFGEYVGNLNAVAVNSGTSALTLALRIAGVNRGDKVITTPMTCSATNLPILSLGAIPVFADVDPMTGLIDTKSVERLITKDVKAIMCCDWGGAPCDIPALMKIAKKHNIKVIEDAAHALGAYIDDEMVGSIADFTCFSFQAIKHITTVDGGMLTCLGNLDMERAKLLRWFGINRDSDSKDTRIDEDILDWGYKFHMNDVTATMGIEQMKLVKSVISAHRANAYYYDRCLPKELRTASSKVGTSSHWLYTIVLPNKVARDKFKDYMLDAGIQVSQVHRRNDKYSVFKPYAEQFISDLGKYVPFNDLSGTTAFSNTMICIPVHAQLTRKELEYITKTINRFVDEYRGWM